MALLFQNTTDTTNASVSVRSKMRHVLADIKSVPVVSCQSTSRHAHLKSSCHHIHALLQDLHNSLIVYTHGTNQTLIWRIIENRLLLISVGYCFTLIYIDCSRVLWIITDPVELWSSIINHYRLFPTVIDFCRLLSVFCMDVTHSRKEHYVQQICEFCGLAGYDVFCFRK